MKKEILMLIIGILLGAIIATGVFLVLQGNSSSTESFDRGETRGDMSSMDGNFVPGDMSGLNTLDEVPEESDT